MFLSRWPSKIPRELVLGWLEASMLLLLAWPSDGASPRSRALWRERVLPLLFKFSLSDLLKHDSNLLEPRSGGEIREESPKAPHRFFKKDAYVVLLLLLWKLCKEIASGKAVRLEIKCPWGSKPVSSIPNSEFGCLL